MKIGITASTFDLFHAGHVLMLQEAKQHCDYLICALQTDPSIDRPNKNKPVQSIFERYTQVEACKYVDQVIPYESELDLLNIFASIPLHIRIIGVEYKEKEFTGKQLCIDRGIEIYYNSRGHNFSSSELRMRVAENTK